jgi:hypothetical protein
MWQAFVITLMNLEIQSGTLLDELNEHYLLRKDHVPWSEGQ